MLGPLSANSGSHGTWIGFVVGVGGLVYLAAKHGSILDRQRKNIPIFVLVCLALIGTCFWQLIRTGRF